MQDKVSRAQSFPAYRSCCHTSGLHRIKPPAPCAGRWLSWLLLQEPHTPSTQAQLSAPKQRAPSRSADLAAFHMCCVSHMTFFSLVCSLESYCLFCNHVHGLENLVQIHKSQLAFEMWQDLSFSNSLQPRALDMTCYLCALAFLSLLSLSCHWRSCRRGKWLPLGQVVHVPLRAFQQAWRRADLQWRAVFAVSTTAEMEDFILEPLKQVCVQTQDLWTTEDGLDFSRGSFFYPKCFLYAPYLTLIILENP